MNITPRNEKGINKKLRFLICLGHWLSYGRVEKMVLHQQNGAGLDLGGLKSCKQKWIFKRPYLFGKCPVSAWNVSCEFNNILE